jgi:hypothetical protein
MARNIRTKKVNALKSVSNISSGDEFIVSTSEQNEDGSTTTAVKKVAQNVLEAKIVDAAVSAIGDIGGGGGAAVTENTIAVNTFSSNTYARSTNFVFNKNGKVLETEAMNIANPCTVTVCVNITTNGATNNSYAVLKVKTPNMHEWMDVENIPINISATSSVNYSFSNMKIFSGVSLKVVVYDTGNAMQISGSSVNLNEFKNDGDFTDHGETFVYLVSSGDYLSNSVIDIPNISGTNNGVIRTRGYVSVITCFANTDATANYAAAQDRSVNFYLQVYDSNSTMWKTVDVVSLYVNLGASSLHTIEFNDVFVSDGARLRILSSYKYPTNFAIGPYINNNFIIKFESLLDMNENTLPTEQINFASSDVTIGAAFIDNEINTLYDGTVVKFKTAKDRLPVSMTDADFKLRGETSTAHNYTSLLPVYSTTDVMSQFIPTFIGIRHVSANNNSYKRDAGYLAQITCDGAYDGYDKAIKHNTVMWGDQDGEIAFTMTCATPLTGETTTYGRFYGNYSIVLNNNVKSLAFSCEHGITQDNGKLRTPSNAALASFSYATTKRTFTGLTSTSSSNDYYRPYIQNLISVDKFGSNVTDLGPFCFTGAANLENVKFNTTQTTINFDGFYGFYGCKKITEIMIPDNIIMDSESSLNEGCFAMCNKLQTLGLPRFFSFASRCISGCQSLTNLYMHNLEDGRNLPQYSICDCPNLAVIDLRKFTTFASSGIVDVGQNTVTNDEQFGTYDTSTIIFDYHTIFKSATQATTADATLTFPQNMVYNYVSNQDYARMNTIKIYNTVIPEDMPVSIDTYLTNIISYSLIENALPAKRKIGELVQSRTYYFYSDEGETKIFEKSINN